ncbi:ribose-5-phosphate isomerase [Streptomyces yunnanensis]|uniref:Ribose-5-phosphate isomerase n=2 Tax=Streptomyces yunnanensis TaxID=156453 RepID=A0A9X8QZA2_9ACTN|nr:ribose-5-phosphate isomerase [Streptomyces yunnanensis]
MVAYLTEHGYPVTDLSATAGEDYPDVAERVARSVARGAHERAVLVCGTGIGMAIAANKIPGIRAAQIPDSYSAERARKSNDAQIACFGSRTMGVEAALLCLRHRLDSDFAGGTRPPRSRRSSRSSRATCARPEHDARAPSPGPRRPSPERRSRPCAQ